MKVNKMFDHIRWLAGKIPFMILDKRIRKLDVIADTILSQPAFGNYNCISVCINFKNTTFYFDFESNKTISCWAFIIEINSILKEQDDLKHKYIVDKIYIDNDNIVVVNVERLHRKKNRCPYQD